MVVLFVMKNLCVVWHKFVYVCLGQSVELHNKLNNFGFFCYQVQNRDLSFFPIGRAISLTETQQ